MPTGPDRIRPDPTGGFGTSIGGVPTGSDRIRPDPTGPDRIRPGPTGGFGTPIGGVPTGSDRIRPQHFLWVYGFLFSSANYYISHFLLFLLFLDGSPCSRGARGVRTGTHARSDNIWK